MEIKREKAVFCPVRCLMHIPVGVIAGCSLIDTPALGAGILAIFGFYEIDECFHIHDRAYIDVIGCLVGLCGVAVFDLIWRAL